MATKNHNKKAQWINNIIKELEGLEEGSKAEIHIDLLKTSLKKSNWKTAGHDGIHGFLFKKFTSIHDRLALEMNRCLQGAHRPEWMSTGKITLIQKDPSKGTAPKQLQTHNLPTDDVENINSTNKGRDLLLANKLRIVPWGTEKMLQRIQRRSKVTLHRSAHPKREQNQTEKSSYGLDWLQNGIWYGSAKLENKLPKNARNIRWSHKLYYENHENLESGIDSRRKEIAEAKIQRGIFQGDAQSPLLFIIAMMPFNHILRKCTAGYKLTSQEKMNHLMYMDDIKLFIKNEKELETLIHAVRIYNRDIGMGFGIEKCHAGNEK